MGLRESRLECPVCSKWMIIIETLRIAACPRCGFQFPMEALKMQLTEKEIKGHLKWRIDQALKNTRGGDY